MPQTGNGKPGNNIFLCSNLIITSLLAILTASCGMQPVSTTQIESTSRSSTDLPGSPAIPTVTPEDNGNLTSDQIATLTSLKKIDDHPLYTMNYIGALPDIDYLTHSGEQLSVDRKLLYRGDGWACSLFAALGDKQDAKFGRNFDWEHSPALLLFSAPPGRFASVTMVDLSYLGFSDQELGRLYELELIERIPLLNASSWPFDGMNERGLAIGMAAVPGSDLAIDPQKPGIGSLEIMRQVLDHAADIGEAVKIMESYNIDFRGGPDLHYLIADKFGAAVLVEYVDGSMQTILNNEPWHLATNYHVSAYVQQQGHCARYDKIAETMLASAGNLDTTAVQRLLAGVSQSSTQWSIIYNLDNGVIQVSMSRHFSQPYEFQLNP